MSISIIIPVLDDNNELSLILETIRHWKEQPLEIIVVDAKADKKCKQICEESGAVWLAFNKSRGAQLRFGAQHAQADALWFLYADCIPHQNSLAAIKECLKKNRGGFFTFAFNLSTKNLTQRILEFFINWRSKHFSVYGDQGLFFDKQAYFVLDGHADQTLFEEVKLVKKMKTLGFRQVALDILVSPRQWEKEGYWTRTWKNRHIVLRHLMGASSNSLKNDYYSG